MVKIKCLLILLCVGFVRSTIDENWKKYKMDYNKMYESTDEENSHFENFKQNLKEIEKHNQFYRNGLKTYKKGITKFADLTGEQFTNIYGLPQGPLMTYISNETTNNNTRNGSESCDWRNQGAVTRVKDQGTCGACWIFSAVGVLEGYLYRKTNKLVTLSEQNMVDCISNKTCHGGWSPNVFDYLRNRGINKEEDYPYKGKSSQCRHDKLRTVKIEFEGYERVHGSEEAIKEAVIKHGPILVMISANQNWKLYKGGVLYEDKCSEWTNHSILLVGFGRENGQDYWLLKNSWGKDWGENGYIKFARNRHVNYCGFTESAYFLK